MYGLFLTRPYRRGFVIDKGHPNAGRIPPMKSLFSKTILSVALVLFFCAAASAQTRIATVNLNVLQKQYWKAAQGQAAIKGQMAEKQKQLDSMLADYKKLQDAYTKLAEAANDQAVSADERARRQKEASAKQAQMSDAQDAIQQFKRQTLAALQTQAKLMTDNTLADIYAVVKAKARAGNYDLVLNASALSANQTPIVLYVSNKIDDLTGAVLKQLNSTAPTAPDSAANKPPAGP
jgi:outer membrane protein